MKVGRTCDLDDEARRHLRHPLQILPYFSQHNHDRPGQLAQSDHGRDRAELTLGTSNLNLVGTSLLEPTSALFSCSGSIRRRRAGGKVRSVNNNAPATTWTHAIMGTRPMCRMVRHKHLCQSSIVLVHTADSAPQVFVKQMPPKHAWFLRECTRRPRALRNVGARVRDNQAEVAVVCGWPGPA